MKVWSKSEAFPWRFAPNSKHRVQVTSAKIDTTNQHKLPPERAPPLAPNLFDPSVSEITAKTNKVRAIWAGPTTKVTT